MFAIALVMPLFPVLVGALYWRRATAAGAVVATVAGVITVLLTYFLWKTGDTWYGAYGMLVSTVLLILVSYLTPKTDSEVLDKFYGTLDRADAKYYAN